MDKKDEPKDLVFDSKYRKLRDDFAEKYFGGKGKMRDTCLFALAIGMKKNRRVKKEDWEDKPLSWTDLGRLNTEVADFEVLFNALEINKKEENTKMIIDEFVTGGFEIIDELQLQQDGNFSELRSYIPELFNE